MSRREQKVLDVLVDSILQLESTVERLEKELECRAMGDETIYRIGLEQDNAELHRINTELNWVVQDLIAELRDEVAHYPPDLFPPFTDDDPASQSRTVDRTAGVAMRHAWTRAGEMADRAEARLREMQGE